MIEYIIISNGFIVRLFRLLFLGMFLVCGNHALNPVFPMKGADDLVYKNKDNFGNWHISHNLLRSK